VNFILENSGLGLNIDKSKYKIYNWAQTRLLSYKRASSLKINIYKDLIENFSVDLKNFNDPSIDLWNLIKLLETLIKEVNLFDKITLNNRVLFIN